MERFTGKIEVWAVFDKELDGMVDWVNATPLEDWPQQQKRANGGIRPAMVNDSDPLPGFAQARRRLTARFMWQIREARDYNHMLSVVMPGDDIYPHADKQPEDWLFRVHIPLVTNDKAWFFVEGERFHLSQGTVYLVNTERVHEIRNEGDTPRIHYMFDVKSV